MTAEDRAGSVGDVHGIDRVRATDSRTPVWLAGVRKGASEAAIRLAVREAAESATDFSWLTKGDPVLIKVAMNSGNVYPAATSPVAIAAMIELLREKGAGRIIAGDMAGIQYVKLRPSGLKGSTRRLMGTAGLGKAVEVAGAELCCFEEWGWDAFYEDYPAQGTSWQGCITMPRVLKEVEHIILMPRCGRHLLAGASLGLKAAVGYWRTDTRLEYHRDATTFHEKTAEGNTVPTLLQKQRLVLTAADKVLVTYGPDWGGVVEPETGLILASRSVVAHDMVSLAWLLATRQTSPLTGRLAVGDNSRLLARLGNRVISALLSGWRTGLGSEPLIKNELPTIWDDRVLNHAYRVFGGQPKVVLEAANDLVPGGLAL